MFEFKTGSNTVLFLLPGKLSKWADYVDQARADGAVVEVVNFAEGTLREYTNTQYSLLLILPS
jgi:hypothetical protein